MISDTDIIETAFNADCDLSTGHSFLADCLSSDFEHWNTVFKKVRNTAESVLRILELHKFS